MESEKDKGMPGQINPIFEITTKITGGSSGKGNWRLRKSELQKTYADMLVRDFPDLAAAYRAAALSGDDEICSKGKQRVADQFFEKAPIDRDLFPNPASVLNAFRYFESQIIGEAE